MAENVCVVDDKLNFRGTVPESWHCVDCGRNTAPAFKNRAQTEQAFQIQKLMGKDGAKMVTRGSGGFPDYVWRAEAA